MPAKVLTLKTFVLQKADAKNMSLRQLAAELGISHSYLSQILNKKKPLDVILGNKIADYFNVPRVSFYKIAGWVDLNEDEQFIEQFKEYAKKNPEFEKFVKALLNMKDEKERKRLLRVIHAGISED